MTGPYSKEKFLELVRAIFLYLRQRDLNASTESLKNEAVSYGHFILSQASSWQSNLEKPVQNTYEDLQILKESMEAVIKVLNALSEDGQTHIWINEALRENPLHPGVDGWKRLQGLMYESDEIITNAFSVLKSPQKGRPKQTEKEDFIEAVLQVFEGVRAISINSLDNLPVKDQRKIKSDFYNFLDLAVFNENLFQSKEARRRFTDRYIEAGRNQREAVSDSLKEHLAVAISS